MSLWLQAGRFEAWLAAQDLGVIEYGGRGLRRWVDARRSQDVCISALRLAKPPDANEPGDSDTWILRLRLPTPPHLPHRKIPSACPAREFQLLCDAYEDLK